MAYSSYSKVNFFNRSGPGTHHEENVPPQLLQVEANFDANEGETPFFLIRFDLKRHRRTFEQICGDRKDKGGRSADEIVSAVISLYEDTRSCVRVSACECV